MRVLVVDNYDSFVFNLVQYLGQLGVHAVVWRNDDSTLLATDADVAKAAEEFDGILLSPGPGTPERAGASIPLVRACAAAATPLLGVCLGHQAIGVAFGGTVDRAPELLHGKTSERLPLECRCAERTSGSVHRDAVPLADDPARHHARRPRGHRADGGRRRHGRAARRAADPRRAVPPRVDPHRGRPPDARQLARAVRPAHSTRGLVSTLEQDVGRTRCSGRYDAKLSVIELSAN